MSKFKDCTICGGTGWITEKGTGKQIKCEAPYQYVDADGKVFNFNCNNGLILRESTLVIPTGLLYIVADQVVNPQFFTCKGCNKELDIRLKDNLYGVCDRCTDHLMDAKLNAQDFRRDYEG